MRRLALFVVLAGCGTTVDPAGLPSADNYTSWSSFAVDTEVPGHGDTYRIIYFNDIAKSYPHGSRYPVGSVIVKEIHDKAGPGQPGALQSIAIMRKVGDAPVSAPVNAGWVFSEKSSPTGEETSKDSCYSSCHKIAPFDSAWHDYGE